MTDYQLSMEDIHLLRQWFPRVIFLLSCLGCFEPGKLRFVFLHILKSYNKYLTCQK